MSNSIGDRDQVEPGSIGPDRAADDIVRLGNGHVKRGTEQDLALAHRAICLCRPFWWMTRS
jgi:hypothetical protein